MAPMLSSGDAHTMLSHGFLSKDIVDPLAEQEWTKQAFIFKDSTDWLKARYRHHRELGHTNRCSGA